MNEGQRKVAVFRTDNRGFTLVELLVSLVIFSLLMLTATYTLRMAGSLLHKTERRYAEETRNLSRLRDSIASSFYYAGERRDLALSGKEYYYHFYGEARELEYVSSRPLDGNELTLTRLSYQDGTLLLEEAPLYNLKSDFKRPAMPAEGVIQKMLMEGLESLKISYLRDGRLSTAVEETLPDGVGIKYKKVGMSEPRELFVSIKSNFSDKKKFMEDFLNFDGEM